MLNPLIAAQYKLYDIQQNINNALNDSYHKKNTAISASPYSNYVSLTTSASGDLSQDLLLTNSNSVLSNAKTEYNNITTASKWLDNILTNKPIIRSDSLEADIDNTMDWYTSNINTAEQNVVSQNNHIGNTLDTINSLLSSIAETNKFTNTNVNTKDIQFQQLSELSKYISFSARYEGPQLELSLSNGQPLVVGESSAILTINNDDLKVSFEKASFILEGSTISGSIGAEYETKQIWQNITNNLTAQKNQLAIKVNALNVSNGNTAIYSINEGSFMSKPNNIGNLTVEINNIGLQQNMGINTTIDADGTYLTDSNNLNIITAVKLENNNNVYNIYTQSTTNESWTLTSSDNVLSSAINNFNSTNSSLKLSNLNVLSPSSPGDTWIWQASQATTSKINDLAPEIQIGMRRTDTVNNNASLEFNNTTAAYTPVGALTLSISNTNTLDGFSIGSTVRVIHSDNSYSDYIIGSTGSGPVWENGATYQYSGIQWSAKGEATIGNTWKTVPVSHMDNIDSIHLADLNNNDLSTLQNKLATASNTANNQLKLNQTYYNSTKLNWQSVSGVNLDEEAQELQKTQQWYQALVKTESIKNSLWDTFISSI